MEQDLIRNDQNVPETSRIVISLAFGINEFTHSYCVHKEV